MEQAEYVDATLRLYERLRDAGHDTVGTVLQSYLYRTMDDLERLLPRTPNLRIVKGAYLEPASIAYPDKADVDRAYVELVERGLRGGAYIAVATHDEAIIRRVQAFAELEGIARDRFEFQMLYGVRPALQRSIAAEGYKVLVAAPFGPDWYPYLMRRLAERPANLGFFLRNSSADELAPSDRRRRRRRWRRHRDEHRVPPRRGRHGRLPARARSARERIDEPRRRAAFARSSRIRSTSRSGCASIEAFTRFAERPGAEIDLHQVGYLFLLDRADDVAAFEESVALQNELGVPSRFVEPDEIRELCPIAGLDGVLAATYCPLDGAREPRGRRSGIRSGCPSPRRDGAHRLRGDGNRRSTARRSEASRRPSAQSRRTRSSAPRASWSPAIASSVGVELPVEPYFREVGFTGPTDGLPDAAPADGRFLVAASTSTARGRGSCSGWPTATRPPGFDVPTDPAWLEGVMEVAERRLPSLLDMGIAGGWKGYYEVTPDHNALVGRGPECQAVPLRHGLLRPRVPARPGDRGDRAATSSFGTQPFVDVAPLAVERFARSAARPERNVI